MTVPVVGITLGGWADISQFVIAISAFLAIIGAAAQLWANRANARRVRVYEYADRFNRPEILRATGEYKDFWKTNTFAEFKTLPLSDRLEWMMLPNLVEEVAWLYNRNLLDRTVAAELLGVYVEGLWAASIEHIMERRSQKNLPGLFSEWEQMQEDTPDRMRKAFCKAERRRARRKLLHGR